MSHTISILVIGESSYESNLGAGLAARGFGASNITFASRKDNRLIKYFKMLDKKWGGNFTVEFTKDWKDYIQAKKNYKTIYLTRSGVPINKVSYSIKTYKNLLVILTEREQMKGVSDLAHFSVSITTQPHPTASAIALFLHYFYEGRELAIQFPNAKSKIVTKSA